MLLTQMMNTMKVSNPQNASLPPVPLVMHVYPITHSLHSHSLLTSLFFIPIVQKVRKELEARQLQVDDDEVRHASSYILPKAAAGVTGPGSTVPVGKGKLPAMEISVNHDQVTRIQALTSEMSVLRDNYTALGSSKDAIDRRAIDLQRELEATRSRADTGTYPLNPLSPHPLKTPTLTIQSLNPLYQAAAALLKLQTENKAQKSSYDLRVVKYETDYKTLSGEWEGMKKAHEAHLVSCRATSTASEKRIAELEALLKTSQTEFKTSQTELKKCQADHASHLTTCTSTSAQSTKRIAELEGQLAAALVAAKTSQTEHSSHLLNCTAASAQSTKRILELEAQLTAAAAQSTKEAKRIGELEGQQKKTGDELAELMKKFMDLTAAKVKTDGMNTELQDLKRKDAATLVLRDGRIKELEMELLGVKKQLGELTAAKDQTSKVPTTLPYLNCT